MARLYVFGIGGTGSRVIKSLTMLLGSGVQLNGFDFVPIIIDPDQNNGDVTRTIDALNNYKAIRSKLTFDSASSNEFFKTKIGFNPDNSPETFRLVLSNVEDDEFREFIDFPGLNESDKAFLSMLFSEKNLKSNMEVGFKGNPNIGSVVLNQFKDTEMYKTFSSTFGAGDRIFIISSIFGGTGAAGFPLILKNLKEPDPQVNNHALIQNAPVGAVTVLPYFGVKKDESSEIDQSTFVSKAKAALYYYQHNVNKSINSIYYIGDEIKESYDNNEGASSQKNAAHFVELAAAMSIVDFSKTDDSQLRNDLNGLPIVSKSLEFGVKLDSDPLSFSDLGDSSKSLLTRSLTQFLLFHKFTSDYFPNNLEQAAWRSGTEIKGDFLTGDFYSGYLKRFRSYFEQWLKELSGNRRSFNPFNLEVDSKHIFDVVNGYKPRIGMFESGSNYSRIQHHANHSQNNMANLSPENKYVSVMFQATKKTVEEKYNF
jgi:hypothetical protein